MTERSGTQVQDIEEHHQRFPAPRPPSFREKFLEDFNRFVRGSGYYMPPPTHDIPLSADDLNFFTIEVPQYIKDYVNYHASATNNRHKPSSLYHGQNNYPMERYIDQNDDPFSAPALLQKNGHISSLPGGDVGYMPGPGDPRVFIQQVNRDVSNNWATSDFAGISAMTTTHKFHNKNPKEAVESVGSVGFSIESGVGGLCPRGPPSRKSASRARSPNGTENTDRKKSEGSSARGGNEGKRPRRDDSFAGNQGSSERVATSRRQSEGSKVSSSRREAKQHICPECHESFPFDARLRSHMAVHRRPEDKLRCSDCGSEFGRDSSLKRHKNTPGSCQKKKQAKLRASTFQGALGLRPGSNSNFDGDAATSVASSYRGSDNASIDNTPTNTQQHPQMRPGSNPMANNHASTNSRFTHGVHYGQSSFDSIPGPYQQPFPNTGRGPPPRHLHRVASPQDQGATEWAGIDPALWPNNFVDFDLVGDNEGG